MVTPTSENSSWRTSMICCRWRSPWQVKMTTENEKEKERETGWLRPSSLTMTCLMLTQQLGAMKVLLAFWSRKRTLQVCRWNCRCTDSDFWIDNPANYPQKSANQFYYSPCMDYLGRCSPIICRLLTILCKEPKFNQFLPRGITGLIY